MSKMVCSRRRWKIVLFIIEIAAVICTSMVLERLLVPSHTQVSCTDPAIRRPHREDTVPTAVVVLFAVFAPFSVMVIVEWVFPATSTSSDKSPLRQALGRSFRYSVDHMIGVLFVLFLTDLIKIMVGAARPNFWDVCRPNITQEQCQQMYVPVTVDDCTNPHHLPHHKVLETFKSFPSGHAATSTFISVFVIIYLQQRLWRGWTYLLVPWLQLTCAFLAVYCCQSRVWDNKHHWWDVLAGALFGIPGAFLVVHSYCNWFYRGDNLKTSETSDDDLHTTHSSPTMASRSIFLPHRQRQEDQGQEEAAGSQKDVRVTP